MSRYRRCYQSGRNYFFTLVTYHRQSFFHGIENVNRLKTAINKVKISYPFSLNAIVVLPDHLHCLWRLPNDDSDFSLRWRLKTLFFNDDKNIHQLS